MSTDDLPPVSEPWWKTAGWRWTLVGLTIVLLIASFYMEENWRGEAAWNQAKADIAAAGESIDPNKFIPPPIPDDQNFGALPVFRLEADPSAVAPALSYIDGPMKWALARVSNVPYDATQSKEADALPYIGNWGKSEPSDISAIRKRLLELCLRSPSPRITDSTPLPILLDHLCPSLAELREANATHPFCQFIHEDRDRLPFERSLLGIVSQLKLAKVLAYQEQLALLDHQPQLALDDMKVEWKIKSGLDKEPTLVAGLISLGIVAYQMGVIEQGLATHVWNDQQLADLDRNLAQIDELKRYPFILRSEIAVFTIPSDDYYKKHRSLLREAVTGYRTTSSGSLEEQCWDCFATCLTYLVPGGWFDQFKSDIVRTHLLSSVHIIDPEKHRAFPEKERATLRQIQNANQNDNWRKFLEGTASPLISCAKKFACAQARVDEARIVCQLERYRLAHGNYPKSLAELAVAEMPSDVMSGQAYRYERQNDDTYRLYSVGWNQIDDHGQTGANLNHFNQNDLDWVWKNHPDTAKTK